MGARNPSKSATKQDLLDLEKKIREDDDKRYEPQMPAWFYPIAVVVLLVLAFAC